MTDAHLVAAVRAGDDRAFECLYTRYHRRIASYVYGMVHDYGRAEDISQEVFMSALRRMRQTDRTIAFKPWIYEIAKNACIDQFRRSRRTEEVSYDADEGLGAADYGRLVNTGQSPDAAVDTKQALDHLRGAFGGLSETHHEILVMRELEGLSYREIGERLGMSRPSVESTLFRARRRLSEEYEELVSGERCSRVQAIIASCVDGALGTRDRRRMARHVSYCQPCRRHARLAGVDPSDLVVLPVRAKIAAFLPLPAFLKGRWGGEGADAGAPPGTWTTQLASFDPGAVLGWTKAAAAAATVAIAGAGAGVAGHPQGTSLRASLPGGSLIDPGAAGTDATGDPAVVRRPTVATAAGDRSRGFTPARTRPRGQQREARIDGSREAAGPSVSGGGGAAVAAPDGGGAAGSLGELTTVAPSQVEEATRGVTAGTTPAGESTTAPAVPSVELPARADPVVEAPAVPPAQAPAVPDAGTLTDGAGALLGGG